MRAILATIAVVAVWAASASAVTLTSGAKVKAGTKVACILAEGVDSRTLKVGSDFELRIDDPSQPALQGAKIVGHVTDVAGPGGLDRARIGFTFDYIRFADKTRSPIHAIVLARNVTQVNTAAARQEAARFQLPPMPVGTVTPGPIAFQINFRQDAAPSVTPPPVGQSSGYVYAQKSNENIVIPSGTSVTIQLTHDLTVT
ncbi:MAG TPA: hypothetical protein VMF61_03495 [Candidatus Acidoferrales bacterium]|nr:hypothetical protein [Candidatus Acidoferrales bacterium]